MPLDPSKEFDRVIAFAFEAERRDAAQRAIEQFNRGVLTVADLAEQLNKIVDGIQPTGVGS